MRYRLLGNLEIGDDGQTVVLPGGHQLLVLAALLVNPNRRMSHSELVHAAWGSKGVAIAQLHKVISELRKLLSQAGGPGDLVTHLGHGYELRVPDDEMDALLFQHLVVEAGEARSAGRSAEEAALLRQALRLWRGSPPLANVSGDAFAFRVDDLLRRRRRAAVRLFDLELAWGHYEQALDELTVIAGEYPIDGRLCEQLLIAAHRCGDVGDGLAAYQRHAESLERETGAAPDAALRDLRYAVSRGDEVVIAAAERGVLARSGLSRGVLVAMPRQLPPAPPDFVGRDELIAEAERLLGRELAGTGPVVVICGPGGMGKTALALRVAHRCLARYPDGQLFAEMRDPVGQPVDPSEVLAQFLRGLGATVPESRAERAAAYRTLLADRQVLVMLDDADSGAQVRDLVPAAPGCGMLVTARRKLPDIAGAYHVATLEPLDAEAATALFLRVNDQAGVNLRADLDAVGQVVALCFGLPLAVRVAASLRARDHPRSTSELAARLAQHGPEAFEFDDQSVARTIGASFERLDREGQQLFFGLGLLRLSSFGLGTAAALLGHAPADPAATLLELAASAIIQPAGEAVRYRFHDLTREYAYRRAIATLSADERHGVLERGYGVLLTLERRAHARLYGGDFELVHSGMPDWDAPEAAHAEVEASPQEWFEIERVNIRAAVSHCAELGLVELCWDLAVSAHEFYTIGGYFDDWHATHVIALEACREAGDVRGEAMVLTSLGQPALVSSRPTGDAVGVAELERAIELFGARGDAHGQAIAQRTLGNALRRMGQLTRPLKLFTHALAGYAGSGDAVGHWQALRYIGHTQLDMGHHEQALATLRAAEQAAERLAKPRLLAQTRYWLGQACLAIGDLNGAGAAFDAVLDVFPDATSVGHAYAMHGLGDLGRLTGAHAVAERRLEVAANLARDQSDTILEGRVGLSLAALHAARRATDQRIGALRHAAECFRNCNAVALEARALSTLGYACEERGDMAAARLVWSRVESRYAEMALPSEDRLYRRSTDTVP